MEDHRGRAGSPIVAIAAGRVGGRVVARAKATVNFAGMVVARADKVVARATSRDRAATVRRAARPMATWHRAKRTAIVRRGKRPTATSPCAIRWCRTTMTIDSVS